MEADTAEGGLAEERVAGSGGFLSWDTRGAPGSQRGLENVSAQERSTRQHGRAGGQAPAQQASRLP